MEILETIESPIGNYYGVPYAEKRKRNKKICYFFCIENWSGSIEVEVSRRFYQSFKNEFEREGID